jgi:hypothetical protein
MQEIFIVGFLCLAVKLQRDMNRTRKTVVDVAVGLRILYTLYFSLAMITIRIIYRFVEFSSGSTDNYLTRHEAYFYVLEAAPMVLAIAMFNIIHPAATINGPGSEMPGLLTIAKRAVKGFLARRTRRKNKLLVDETVGEELPRRYQRID